MSAGAGTRLVGRIHGKIAHGKRVSALAHALAAQLRPGQQVLDIGCGDGILSAILKERVPELQIQGVEDRVRPGCAIPCRAYDGANLPFPGESFDVCMLVDVLHHTPDVRVLLKEACRVSRSYVLLKDHLAEDFLDHLKLKAMDWIGNRAHGVPLPYNYQSRDAWDRDFQELGLTKRSWTGALPPYPGASRWLGLNKLHFVTLLQKGEAVLSDARSLSS